ncbi:uncharacterized protein ARMOST_06110 [Armillaria ostoyae]|uniref:Uncharacterized protein n=1 Tax=Armillaria ostoyae TaxID=47428 RepID=A0A284R210_ARMOS|nr:uncharacterized protein ARMOST_06110 [Armillaria ostoyae]
MLAYHTIPSALPTTLLQHDPDERKLMKAPQLLTLIVRYGLDSCEYVFVFLRISSLMAGQIKILTILQEQNSQTCTSPAKTSNNRLYSAVWNFLMHYLKHEDIAATLTRSPIRWDHSRLS